MRLYFRNIVLRDYRLGDEEDMVRWMTVQTEWHQHDSPWLAEKDLAGFDPEKYRGMALEYLKHPQRFGERSTLQIEDRHTGRHIGFVSAYYLDKQDDPLPVGQVSFRRAVGLDICEPAFRGEGRGTHALTAFLQYLFCHSWQRLFLQTWTGNPRMMHVAQKLGFRPLCTHPEIYTRDGVSYDNITYCLESRDFRRMLSPVERAGVWLASFMN